MVFVPAFLGLVVSVCLPFAPARLRLAYCESPLHFLSRTLFRHGRGFARAAFSSLVAGVVVSSLRRFARPATMPGDAIPI